MKRVIEVTESYKVTHQIFVDYENEEDLDNACDNAERFDNLDDYIDGLSKYVKVTNVNEEYYTEPSDKLEYLDDYEDKE